MRLLKRILKVVGVVLLVSGAILGVFIYMQCSKFDASMDKVYDVPLPSVTRSEDPAAILAEIEPGLQATGAQYTIEVDRAAAIRLALQAAQPGDVVLLAGKGHEKEQILAGRTIPFDDAEVALSILRELGYGEGQ